MGVCNISLIIFDKNSCKICSNNSQNHDSFYTEDSINKASVTGLGMTCGRTYYHSHKSKKGCLHGQ